MTSVGHFTPELLQKLRRAVPADGVITTLSNGKPNRIVELAPHGVLIETDRSRMRGAEPQLVPAWMVQRAWEHIEAHGTLTNSELISTDGLNVKRSSAVCALLAQLPDIEVVSTRPIVLRRQLGSLVRPNSY